jgi:glycosyltransferase involved in cell wall biosynthesis
MKKIVLLFQTPPPLHGQAVILDRLVREQWHWCNKIHIRLHYSDKVSEVGKFSFKKISRWLEIVAAVIRERIKGRIDIIAYSPAPPNRLPFYRDLMTLPLLRVWAGKIIFHFHGGGFDKLSQKLFFWEKLLAKKIYWQPDLAIVLSTGHKKEIEWINPREISVIPNAVPDYYKGLAGESGIVTILSIGLVAEDKGILISLKAAKLLKESGIHYRWIFGGSYESQKFKDKVESCMASMSLASNVKFVGEVRGEWKWRLFRQADIVCHPTFYKWEASPVVLLESMMMGKPVVATKWGYIPEIISDGEEGYLIPIKNHRKLADKLTVLIKSKILRGKMGQRGRRRYLDKFTLGKHLESMEEAYRKLADE